MVMAPSDQYRRQATGTASICGGLIIILAIGSIVHAESGPFRSRDGLQGHLSDLGNNVQIYSNAHGIHTPILPRGAARFDDPITLPNGNLTFGHRIPLESDTASLDFVPFPILKSDPHPALHPTEATRPLLQPSPWIHPNQLLP
ncbi:hypothetical protein YTPLAS18_14070 [Nitrospira sp.]|nr:hypothetical protein YTPLAS18_14070 [Nitrospira sp.]